MKFALGFIGVLHCTMVMPVLGIICNAIVG